MKKVIFSAIAMIAFVGSSTANTVTVKNSKSGSKAFEAKSTVSERNCRAEQAAAVKHAKEVEGLNDKDAATAGYIMYFACKSDVVKDMSF